MKKETLKQLELETKACKHYTERAREKAKEGNISAAIDLLDIAQTAKTCADRAHEELWKVTNGKLNDKEFKTFAEAETLNAAIQKAYQAIKAARK